MYTGECDHIRENGNHAVLSNDSIWLVLKRISLLAALVSSVEYII